MIKVQNIKILGFYENETFGYIDKCILYQVITKSAVHNKILPLYTIKKFKEGWSISFSYLCDIMRPKKTKKITKKLEIKYPPLIKEKNISENYYTGGFVMDSKFLVFSRRGVVVIIDFKNNKLIRGILAKKILNVIMFLDHIKDNDIDLINLGLCWEYWVGKDLKGLSLKDQIKKSNIKTTLILNPKTTATTNDKTKH